MKKIFGLALLVCLGMAYQHSKLQAQFGSGMKTVTCTVTSATDKPGVSNLVGTFKTQCHTRTDYNACCLSKVTVKTAQEMGPGQRHLMGPGQRHLMGPGRRHLVL